MSNEASPLKAQSAAKASDALLSTTALQACLAQLPGWTSSGDVIEKTFSFSNYHHTMAFVNAVAWLAHEADHHPDMMVSYNRCTVRWNTHSSGGITLKDAICAAQVDDLLCHRA